jgi:hypothetical protein
VGLGLTSADDAPAGDPGAATARRAVALLVAAVVTAAMLWGVLQLGAWAYAYRRLSYHEGRLVRLVEQRPSLEQVVTALQQEGSPLLASADDQDALRAAAARWAGTRVAEVRAKGGRWPRARVFRAGQAGEMTYFLFFDAAGVLRDHALVAR